MDERIDLTALELDEGRRELLVAAIMANAGAELDRRQSLDVSPMLVLSRWVRPALAAAAVVAVVCVSVLAVEPAEQQPGYGLADELAVPQPADAWLMGEREPTVGDVLVAMERGRR
ncbi:MAG TPA: hypothetical protein VK929_14775 [Longimicrobiales bacterium]|nr:hypothetical protein [Longimicrobiales bacterium]